jgi:hypothetical protein
MSFGRLQVSGTVLPRRYTSAEPARAYLATNRVGDLLLAADGARLGVLHGTVSWSDDRRPVEHGKVLLTAASGGSRVHAQTDRRGQFRLQLPEGTYRASAAVGLQTEAAQVATSEVAGWSPRN